MLSGMTEFASTSDAAVRAIWAGTAPDWTLRQREEALWEWGSRAAAGATPFSAAELDAAFATGLAGIGNVVGALARADRLPPAELARVAAALRTRTEPDVEHGLRQVAARAMLSRLTGGAGAPANVELVELAAALVAQGTAWALETALPFLPARARTELVERADAARTFTKRQHHELRAALRRLA
jgi:hypothetical protein